MACGELPLLVSAVTFRHWNDAVTLLQDLKLDQEFGEWPEGGIPW